MDESARDLIERIKRDRPCYEQAKESPVLRSREFLAEHDPEYLKMFHDLHMHVVYSRKALQPRIKELIICAVDAATFYWQGLWVHIRGALDAGATPDEILEALEAASLPGGIHALSQSLPILDQILEERGLK